MREGGRVGAGAVAWVVTQTACWTALALVAVGLTLRLALPLAVLGAVVAVGGSTARLCVPVRWRPLVTDLEFACYAGVAALSLGTPLGWWRPLALFGVGAAKVAFSASEGGRIVPLWLLGTCAWLLASAARPELAPVVWGWVVCGPLLACSDTFLTGRAERPEAVRRAAFHTIRLLPATAVLWAVLPARGWPAPPWVEHLHLPSAAGLAAAAALAPGQVLGTLWRPILVAGALVLPARMLGRRVGSVLVAAAAFALLVEVFAPVMSLPSATAELATLAAAGAAKRSAGSVADAELAQAVRSVAQAPSAQVLEGVTPQAPAPYAVPSGRAKTAGAAAGGAAAASAAGGAAPGSATGALVPGSPGSFTFAQVGEMAVTAPLPAVPYLRQQSFQTYTGSAWLLGPSDLGALAGGYWGPGYRETATIRLAGDQDPVATPWFSTAVARAGTRFSPDPDWMWFATPFVTGRQAYTASFVVPDIAAVAAKVASAAVDQPPAPGYLQLPPELPPQVRTLANRVVAASGARTPWQKAVALATWLQAAYPYELVAAPPAGADWVYYFLFTARAGFCEDFASAMTVMARIEGIPARLATGYIAPRPTGNRDVYTIWTPTHAWAELYFPAVGWVPFDATSNDIVDAGQLHGPVAAAVGTQDGVWKPLAAGEGLRSTSSVTAGAGTPGPVSVSGTGGGKAKPSARPASSSPSVSASSSSAAAATRPSSAAPASGSSRSGTGSAGARANIAPSSSSAQPAAAASVASAGANIGVARRPGRPWIRVWAAVGPLVLLAGVAVLIGARRLSIRRRRRDALSQGAAAPTVSKRRSVSSAFAAIAEAVGPRTRRWRAARQSRYQRSQVLRAAARVDTAMTRVGWTRRRYQTVAEYWTSATASAPPELVRLLRLFHLARYRSAPLPPGAGKLAARSAHAATRAIRERVGRRRT